MVSQEHLTRIEGWKNANYIFFLRHFFPVNELTVTNQNHSLTKHVVNRVFFGP